MSENEQFALLKRENIASASNDAGFIQATREWFQRASQHRYSYHFEWLGRPVIQFPQDLVALQELIWSTRPSLIVETGIAHGGSLIFSASMLALLDLCEQGNVAAASPRGGMSRRVIGIDIDIRPHNRKSIEEHPLSARIELVQGSSIDPGVVSLVKSAALQHDAVMVILDSNHTHEHVLAELEAYAPMVTRGCYCVVLDTVIEDHPEVTSANRSWGPGDNPKTALAEYLLLLAREGRNDLHGKPLDLEVDHTVSDKLMITVAPGGFLRRT